MAYSNTRWFLSEHYIALNIWWRQLLWSWIFFLYSFADSTLEIAQEIFTLITFLAQNICLNLLGTGSGLQKHWNTTSEENVAAEHEDQVDRSSYHCRLDSHHSPLSLQRFQLWKIRHIQVIPSICSSQQSCDICCLIFVWCMFQKYVIICICIKGCRNSWRKVMIFDQTELMHQLLVISFCIGFNKFFSLLVGWGLHYQFICILSGI